MTFVTLKKRREFQQIARSKERWVCPFFILQGLPHTEGKEVSPSSPLRVGFVITKKMGKAVVRNRIRRRLKAVLRLLLKSPDFQKENLPSYNLVIVARRKAALAPFQALLQEMQQGFAFFSLDSPCLKAPSKPSKSCS